MKFITRELYQSMQDDSDSQAYEAAEQAWYAQCKAYREHLNSIRERLPISMQSFCDITLHDGVIQAAEHCNSSNVRLVVDASHNPWGPTGNFQLSFLGVKQVSELAPLIGEWWLYEEVHLHPQAGFEYRVLLSEGELHIVADQVECKSLP